MDLSVAKIFIVEDDQILRQELSHMLDEMGAWVVGHAPDSDSALQKITHILPDVILMDIDIQGNMNGIELSKQIRQQLSDIIIIYLTSQDDDQSFDDAARTLPFDFLSKPVSRRRLKRTLTLALESRSQKTGSTEEWILKDGSVIYRLKIKDIIHIEAQDKYCQIQMIQNVRHLVRLSLIDAIKALPPDGFIQVHRSHVVNLHHILKYDRQESELTLSNGQKINVSRSKSSTVLSALSL